MAAGAVGVMQIGGVIVLTLDHPPSNALTPGIRAGLLDTLANPGAAVAIVIRGAGSQFSSAITLDPDTAVPQVSAVCLAVERCAVPVIAALNGAAIGPGAELALAATARIAHRQARLALPDIGIGLTPDAGASQRLPALIGPQEALRMLITGRAVPATEALALGLCDEVVDGDVTDAAVRFATALAAGPRPVRPQPGADARAWQAAIAAARAAHRNALPAVGRIIDCVEAALVLPRDAGLAFEAAARSDMEASDEVAGLRAAAQAERRAMTLPAQIARSAAAPVDRIGLHGLGDGMALLAQSALARGVGVIWIAAEAQALAAAVAAIRARQDAELRDGLLTAALREGNGAPLVSGQDPGLLDAAGLVVHLASPDAGVLHRSLPQTPHLVLDGGPGDLGLALAPSGRIAELSLPDDQDPEIMATAIAVLRRIGLSAVLVGQWSVLGRRVTQAGCEAVQRLVRLGVPVARIGAALEAFGARLPETVLPESWGTRSDMTIREVQHRWLGAMANEALEMLDAGIARRPSDVDHLLVAGHQFPRWRGGPMHHADQRGLMVLRRDLRLWAEDDPLWTPAPLIDRLLADGTRLSALNV